jgi:hypothetical protein
VGAECTASISVFSDAACSNALISGYEIHSNGATCRAFDAPAAALGSKSIGPITYTPGTPPATVGGQSQGMAAPAGPVTFCCLSATAPTTVK